MTDNTCLLHDVVKAHRKRVTSSRNGFCVSVSPRFSLCFADPANEHAVSPNGTGTKKMQMSNVPEFLCRIPEPTNPHKTCVPSQTCNVTDNTCLLHDVVKAHGKRVTSSRNGFCVSVLPRVSLSFCRPGKQTCQRYNPSKCDPCNRSGG